MNNIDNEPSLEKIDDYNGKESPSKRKTVYLVIIFCLIVGAFFAYLRSANSVQNDYVGTPEQPGINTTKLK